MLTRDIDIAVLSVRLSVTFHCCVEAAWHTVIYCTLLYFVVHDFCVFVKSCGYCNNKLELTLCIEHWAT